MKQIIGLVLSIIWGLLFLLLICEPTTTEYQYNVPEWIGWVYVILVLGLPFIAVNLVCSEKK